jgi:hypothetical protein
MARLLAGVWKLKGIRNIKKLLNCLETMYRKNVFLKEKWQNLK